MTKEQKIIARALEIAIQLTNAKETWLTTKDKADVIIVEPLFSTVKRVYQILNAENLFNTFDGGKPGKIHRGLSPNGIT
jgi:hypothetical protein